MASITSLKTGDKVAIILGALIVCKGDRLSAAELLRSGGHVVEADIVEKSAVDPLTMGEFSNQLGSVSYDLAAYLRPRTLIGRLPFLPVPFRVRTLLQSAPIAAAWTGEGAPVPFRQSAFASGEILDHAKVASGVLVSEELARAAVKGSRELIVADATAGIRFELDLTLSDPDNAGTSARPASITSLASGAVQFESAGVDVAAFDADIKRAIKSLIDTGCTLESARWFTHPLVTAHLAGLRDSGGALAFPTVTATGGRLSGIEIVTSGGCQVAGSPGEFTLNLVECNEVLLADDGAARLEVSTRVAVQAEDAPGTGEQQLISVWQHDLAALMVERVANWRTRRAGAVACIRGINGL